MMAAFASCRRSGWVRVVVLILCALFIFATIATPPAYAVGETIALFTAAAVLSSAVAALGFKLSTSSEGQSTLDKMVTDFARESWALGLLVVGNRVNGLINGLNYIKMAVHDGKTYLDERVVAWCQQWLGQNGVYDSGGVVYPDYTNGQSFTFSGVSRSDFLSFFDSKDASNISSILNWYNINADGTSPIRVDVKRTGDTYTYDIDYIASLSSAAGVVKTGNYVGDISGVNMVGLYGRMVRYEAVYTVSTNLLSMRGQVSSYNGTNYFYLQFYSSSMWTLFSNAAVYSVSSNDTGLSGTDTIGEDYKDSTLDQILDGLKDWAQDWFDAGADSATNAATGAVDLPLTVGAEAATANPALNPDVVYDPPFALPWPEVRSGETSSSTVSDGVSNADAAQTATTDVAENQTVIDSLVNWALGYISPDTGIFAKFPLCIPYDAYLIVCAALGVDAVDASEVYGASPGDLTDVVTSGVSTQSDFQPIIYLQHDFELDGRTYPIEVTIDLTPWQPFVDVFREGVAILFLAELIAAEYRRIKGH